MAVGRRLGSGFSTMCDGCLHVLPLLVTLTMEVTERKCGGFLMSYGQDGNLEEALSPPIQWMARKREGALPNSSNASEPEPGGDENHDLERDPSERMPPWKGRSERRLSQEAAKRPTQGKRHNRNKGKKRGRQDTATKERRKKKEERRENQTKAQPNQQHRRNRKHASEKHSFDTVAEGSDAESKVGQRLSGVPPWETQRGCTNELIGSDLDEHEQLGRHP